jgi:PPOX class probable F420-dependent enzyme
MDDADIRALLAQPEQAMAVATVMPDGQPHLTVVWYGFLGGRIAFTAPARSQKAANLSRNPQITLMVDAGMRHGELHGVQIMGTATLDDTLATKLAIHASVAERYPTKVSRDPEATMAKRIAVIVEPHKVLSWDHRRVARTQ